LKSGLEMLRISLPPVRYAGAVRFSGVGGGKDNDLKKGDAGFPSGEVIALEPAGEKRYFLGRGKAGELFLYLEEEGRLAFVKKFSFSPGIDALEPVRQGRVAAFSHDGHIWVFDFSSPAEPAVIMTMKIDSKIVDVAAAKKSLCVALEGGGLGVVDFTKVKPGLVEVKNIPPLGGTPIEAGGFRCWAVDASGGVIVVNILDPAEPRMETYISSFVTGEIQGLMLDGNRIYMAARDRLMIVNVSRPDDLVIEGAVENIITAVKGILRVGDSVAVYGASDGGTSFQFIDISEPDDALYLGYYETPFDLSFVQPAGKRLLFESGGSGSMQYRWFDVSCLL